MFRATVASVVVLMSKNFVKLVLLANLIAWQAGWRVDCAAVCEHAGD